jgi:hypothetical protein
MIKVSFPNRLMSVLSSHTFHFSEVPSQPAVILQQYLEISVELDTRLRWIPFMSPTKFKLDTSRNGSPLWCSCALCASAASASGLQPYNRPRCKYHIRHSQRRGSRRFSADMMSLRVLFFCFSSTGMTNFTEYWSRSMIYLATWRLTPP